MNPRVISKRRQVASEQDRYGGYQSDFSAGRDALADDLYAEFRLSRAERGLVGPEFGSGTAYGYTEVPETDFLKPQKEASEAGVIFSKRDKPTEYVGVDTSPAKKRSAGDIMPSIESRPYEKRIERPATRLTASVKTMLVIYIAAVIILSVVVIATGIAITSAQNRLTGLEREAANRAQTVSDRGAELARLSDSEYLAERAADAGMGQTETYREVPLVPVYEPAPYKAETNWFDGLGDFISGLFG